MIAIQFNSLFYPGWVAAISVLAVIIFSWLEIRRKQKLLALRLFAVIVAVVSLSCLVLNPSRTVTKSSDIILLTANYNNNVLDSLINKNSNSQLYELSNVSGPRNARKIDYRDLAELKGNVTVLGEGLPDYALDYIDTSALTFVPSVMREGVTGIRPKMYTANQVNTLEGTYYARGTRSLVLKTSDVTLDSISVNAGLNSFTLTFTPKTPGRFLYTLAQTDSAGNIIAEQFPLKVKSQQTLNILVLNEYPTAETRFLKNYLERQHHKLTLRNKITRDKYRTEFINTPDVNVNRLTENVLRNFDLVITDIQSLATLSGVEKKSLERSVNEGLGLLTIIDNPAPPQSVSDFLKIRLSRVKSDSASLILNKQRLKIPATAAAISSTQKITAIDTDVTNRALSGYLQHGVGKIGFQLLTTTFSLQLSGREEEYATIWSNVITTLARKERRAYDLEFLSPFPYHIDEPVAFRIIAAGDKPLVTFDSADVPLFEDAMIGHVWYGKIWASCAGWNTLAVRQDSTQHIFFVGQEGEWKSIRTYNQQKSLQRIASKTNSPASITVAQPLPRLIFFVLFLLAAGFLWLAPKL
ncbi:MAG: hypothetical protein U0U09_01340 [Cyclobacteriaceae bacterium]